MIFNFDCDYKIGGFVWRELYSEWKIIMGYHSSKINDSQ